MPNVAPLHANDPRRVGRYRLTGRIAGLPAEGPVYLAAMANGTQVTITLLDASWVQTSAAKDRFTAEARAARRVPQFCTARIIDAGVDEGQAYLVREHVAGPSLAELVADEGPLKDSALMALAVGMVTGLAAIHQVGLVHGQFGSEFVVLGVSGPRVIGFGITPPYGSATPAADMLGWAHAVLFAATGLSAAEAGADLAMLAEPLRSLVARCAAADPVARPTARAAVIELIGTEDPSADLLAEGSRRAVRAAFRPPAELPDREPQPAPSRSGAIWWAVGIMVCIVAIAVAVHVLQNQSSKPAVSARQTSRPAATAQLPIGGSSGGGGSSLSAPSASALPSPATGSIPAVLAGTWSGKAKQQTDVFNVQVKMAEGATSGKIRYSGTSFTCTGLLTLVSSADGSVTMSQQITVGQHTCANGMVTLSAGPSGSLQFKFTGAAGPAAEGTLAKH
jgi:eukaryotic-like serine/threonine-protein kinase